MILTRHLSRDGLASGAEGCPRWALDGRLLPPSFTLAHLLELTRADAAGFMHALPRTGAADGTLLPPIEAEHEVWAAGVTYLRSREAREHESSAKDVYSRVYEAARPELFFKATGWRVAGHRMPIRIREDSRWNVPEPELTLVINAHGEIVGFCAGNDVSSRDIEGENPLYLPQAKVYNGSCALGPGIVLAEADRLRDLAVEVEIVRAGRTVFAGDTRTSRMKRSFDELVSYLARELDFPHGVFLMTGTGIVPPPEFTLSPGDRVRIAVGSLTLENDVESAPRFSQR
jgi:2-dehydro-3-deoxy-D-arabinonate dehydratase